MTVEDTENYFVGKKEILVHNFAFVIPVATWIIGEGLFWVTASTIAAIVGTTVLATEISKKSDNRQSGTIEGGRYSGGSGRYEPQYDRYNPCNSRNSNSKSKVTSPNQMNKQIESGSAPNTVKRVDTGKIKGEQNHVHFKDGSALNRDGT